MSNNIKRPTSGTDNEPDKKKPRVICSFNQKCYRKNPHHFMEYDHPHLEGYLTLPDEDIKLPEGYPMERDTVLEQVKTLRMIRKIPIPSKNAPGKSQASGSVASNKNGFINKLEKAATYNLFFTIIPKSSVTLSQPFSFTFKDLLCPSLGELKSSLQINFMIDMQWMMQYYFETGNGKKPLTVVHGYEFPNMKEYTAANYPNVDYNFVKMKDPFGIHHSKIGIYSYTDGSIRVVVSTANLYYEDWNHYCQGVWISPRCLPLESGNSSENEGCGPTNFKGSLISYLKSYNMKCLNDWVQLIKTIDFSNIKVFLVTTVPGKSNESFNSHLKRVGDLLSRHCVLPEKTGPGTEGPLSWSVIAQSSSLGTFGANPASWLRTVLLRSLASHTGHVLPTNSNATFNIVFPTKQNVLNSYWGQDGGGCLPYGKSVHVKQTWLKEYLHQWKADDSGRSKAMPHIKSYCRISPCTTQIAYFLLTSANISKAAWGTTNKSDSSVYCRSYEAGVLFLPKLFDQKYFTVQPRGEEGEKLFPIMYDLPLTPYGSNDEPWTM